MFLPSADSQCRIQQLFYFIISIRRQRWNDRRANVGDAVDTDVVPVVAHHAVAT